MSTGLIILTCGVPIILILLNYISDYVFKYTVSSHGITISYFSKFTIEYNQISQIKKIPIWRVFFLLPLGSIVLFGSRLWGKDAILIKTNVALLNVAVITPNDPDLFIDTVAKMKSGYDPSLLSFIHNYK